MNINPEKRFFSNDTEAIEVIELFEEKEDELCLNDSEIYYKYPLYRDLEGDLIRTHILLISKRHGVVIIGVTNSTGSNEKDILQADNNLGDVFNQIYSRLIKNKNLKRGRKDLTFPIETILFAPNVSITQPFNVESVLVTNESQVSSELDKLKIDTIPTKVIENILSSIDGAAGIVRTKLRPESDIPGSKGNIANKVEEEISTFDRKQKHGYILPLEGIERIRGLAGSGKTIVLAMKAALTHLENPDANILFTFYTKSLYQNIYRLITRFFKQFSEFEPNFEKIKIMHAWGGRSIPGVYYEACIAHSTPYISYQDAIRKNQYQPFDYACKKFLDENKNFNALYDYVFIDEGQDFPPSFIKLCSRITKDYRLVLAYDELQTIFQPNAPSYETLFGDINPKMKEDVILYKCYRNPREIIVCAHALGFGIYGSRVVQMLENKDYWEDVGYIVHEGDFTEGSNIVIERPENNSLPTISKNFSIDEIVSAHTFDNFRDELDFVANSIKNDIEGGLRPDDILIEVVDDRNAKGYLAEIEKRLFSFSIRSHNIHTDSYGLKDFQNDGCVTLSTVHKAKGNESYMVYVVGIDALFSKYSGIRDRNMLFTAMTRAKGWVCLTGVGENAEVCVSEINAAKMNFPLIKFSYPSADELKIMRRDMQESDIKKQKIDRILDEMLTEMSPEDIKKYLDHRSKTKRSKGPRKK